MDKHKRVLNRFEAAAEKAMRDNAATYGARVFSKLSIAQAVEIRGSGLSDEEFAFALKSNFDFVVARMGRAEFAVDLDTHLVLADCKLNQRNAQKDLLSRKLGMPLYRIDTSALEGEQKYYLLLQLIKIWYEGVQEKDRSGKACLVAEHRRDKRQLPSTTVEQSRSGDQSCIRDQSMRCYTVHRLDDLGYNVSQRILQIEEQRFLIGHGRCKVPSLSPIDGHQLADLLTVFNAANRLRGLLLPRLEVL